MKDYERFKPHHGHNIACVGYGSDENIWEYAIECHDCHEILAVGAKYDEEEEEGESLLSISDDGEDMIIDIEDQQNEGWVKVDTDDV